MTPEEFEKELQAIHLKSFQWTLSLCSNETLAEEILQESYLKAFKAIDTFNGSASFKTWLFTIIRNTSFDYFRKNSRRSELDQDFLRGEKSSKTASQELRLRQKGDEKAAEYLLGKLSAREREILELTVYQGLKVKEAAEIMGVSLGSASSYLKRAKKNLKGEVLRERQCPKGPSFEQTYTYQIKKAS